MADHTQNGTGNFATSSLRLKLGLAEMLKGGVIMDVMNVEQARIAEEAGPISVMALQRGPAFTHPVVCASRKLGEALRRISEGAAMIRTKGEPGTGNVVHAVQHMRQIV